MTCSEVNWTSNGRPKFGGSSTLKPKTAYFEWFYNFIVTQERVSVQ